MTDCGHTPAASALALPAASSGPYARPERCELLPQRTRRTNPPARQDGRDGAAACTRRPGSAGVCAAHREPLAACGDELRLLYGPAFRGTGRTVCARCRTRPKTWCGQVPGRARLAKGSRGAGRGPGLVGAHPAPMSRAQVPAFRPGLGCKGWTSTKPGHPRAGVPPLRQVLP